MPPIDVIHDALKIARISCDRLRVVAEFPHAMFVCDVAGNTAVSDLISARHAFVPLGFSPVLIGESLNGENASIRRFVNNVEWAANSEATPFNPTVLPKTAAETLALAEQMSFEAWLEKKRDLQLQSDLKRAEAMHYESLGQHGVAKVMYDWADGILRFPPWTFDPSKYPPPFHDNRIEIQTEPLSIRRWETASATFVLPPRVSMLVCPTPKPWQIPAYTFFMTNDGTIPPQVHTSFLAWLHREFGATIIAIAPRVIEVVAESRPREWIEACRLASDIRTYAQCCMNSTSEVETIEQWAGYLIDSTVWSFCWP